MQQDRSWRRSGYVMHGKAASLGVLLFVSITTVAAQTASPRPVEVVNLPEVQPVTGDELRWMQEALTLLLVRGSGVLPEGVVAPSTEECEIVTLTDFVERETIRIRSGEPACDIRNYSRACAMAAQRHRTRCNANCRQFSVHPGGRSCVGNDRPAIEPFFGLTHCDVDPEYGSTVSCVASGWCSCDPS